MAHWEDTHVPSHTSHDSQQTLNRDQWHKHDGFIGLIPEMITLPRPRFASEIKSSIKGKHHQAFNHY